jgi:hypothetical protein
MCLTSVTKVYDKQTSKVYLGWKVVRVIGKEFKSLYNFYSSFDRWKLACGPTRIKMSPDTSYPAGFHILTTKKDAEKYRQDRDFPEDWTVVRVKYCKVLCVGKQQVGGEYLKCVIAKKMLVMKPRVAAKAG